MNKRNRSKVNSRMIATFKLTIAILMLAATISSVIGSANAFTAFGYTIGAPKKQTMQVPDVSDYSSETVVERNGYLTNENIADAISTANSDRGTTDFMKSFSEEYFCVKTEKRVAYMSVATDGELSLVSDTPNKCHNIKTTEAYLASAWEKYKSGERITYQEVSKHVKIPFAMKTRIALAGLIG